MHAPKPLSSASRATLVAISAAAATSFSSATWAQQVPGQSAFQRGADYKAQLLPGTGLLTQRRTHLIGEFVTKPTIVQAPVGTTVVVGNTAINAGTIVSGEAAQLDVRCPLGGGRVLMFDNRVFNVGRIVAGGQSPTASQVVTHCDHSLIGSVMSERNFVVNTGRIEANR